MGNDFDFARVKKGPWEVFCSEFCVEPLTGTVRRVGKQKFSRLIWVVEVKLDGI